MERWKWHHPTEKSLGRVYYDNIVIGAPNAVTPNRNTRTGDPCTFGQKSSRVPPVSALRHFVAAEGADDVSGGGGEPPPRRSPRDRFPARDRHRSRTSVCWPNAAGATGSEWGVRTAPPPTPPRVFRFCVFCTVVTDSLIRSDIWRFPRTRSHHVARQCCSRCSAVRMFMIRECSSCYVFNPMGL